MTVEKEDLGLSLSLACNYSSTAPASVDQRPRRSAFHLNLMPSLFSASSSSASSTSLTVPNLQFYPAKNVMNPSWLDSAVPRGIDVNRLPANAVEEEEPGVSSPNSTVSSVSGKRSEREAAIGAGGGEDLDLDEEDGDTSRKKLRLSKDQSAILEESFKEHSTLNPKQKLGLAKRLGLRPRQVEVWFQNRRARTKLKQTEVDCEYLKRCCEQLTEENRRLQKEAQELRQLKLSPQFYMQMAPPTTLTMCPSCERVDAPNRRGSPLRPWGVPAPAPVRQFEALRPAS